MPRHAADSRASILGRHHRSAPGNARCLAWLMGGMGLGVAARYMGSDCRPRFAGMKQFGTGVVNFDGVVEEGSN